MKVIYRYRAVKPPDGHFSFQLNQGATVLTYAEHWHTDKGWEVVVDALEDSSEPKETRYFFICNAGDNLSFLGEIPEAFYIGKHESKSYTSYLFETTHLSETERMQGTVQPSRYTRQKPDYGDLSRVARKIEDDRRRLRERPSRPVAVAPPVAQEGTQG